MTGLLLPDPVRQNGKHTRYLQTAKVIAKNGADILRADLETAYIS